MLGFNRYLSLVWLRRNIEPKLDNFKICFFIILLLSLGYRILTLGDLGVVGFDESLYNFFVKNLGERGIEGLRLIIQDYPRNEILMKGPFPFHILYVFIGWLVSKLCGNYSIVNLVLVSFISGISTIMVSFILLRRLFNLNIAFLTSLLLIISPLNTALSRRALQDSFFTFIVMMSFYFYHQSWTRKKLMDLVMLGFTVSCGFFTKQYMLFLYPLFAMAGIYYRKNMPNASLFRVTLPLLIAPLLYLFISLWMAGSFYSYLNAYISFLQMQFKNIYGIRFSQGPWFRYIIDFFLLSPLTYLFSVVGVAFCLSDKSHRLGKDICIIYVLGGFIIFSLLPVLNIRYILFLDIPLRVFSVLGVIFVVKNINERIYRYLFATMLFFIISGIDIYQFFQLFIKSKVYDPVTINLIVANGFIK